MLYNELNKFIKKEIFHTLLQKGAIALSVIVQYNQYEHYLSEMKKPCNKTMRKKNKKVYCIARTAEKFKVSDRQIYRAISFMES